MKILIFFVNISILINKHTKWIDNTSFVSFCFDLLISIYWFISTIFKKIVDLLNLYCDFKILMILLMLKHFEKSTTNFIYLLYQIWEIQSLISEIVQHCFINCVKEYFKFTNRLKKFILMKKAKSLFFRWISSNTSCSSSFKKCMI